MSNLSFKLAVIVVKQRFSILVIRFSSIYKPLRNPFTYRTFFTHCHLKVTYIFPASHLYSKRSNSSLTHAEQSKEDTFGVTFFFFIYTKNTAILLQRDETRRMCSSNTRATVLDWLVGDGELAQVVAAHLRLKKGKKKQTLYIITLQVS